MVGTFSRATGPGTLYDPEFITGLPALPRLRDANALLHELEQFHSFLRSTVITIGNRPPLKEIVPVRHFPLLDEDLSELMPMVYEPVASRSEAAHYARSPLQDFPKTSAEPAYVRLQSSAMAILRNGSAAGSGIAQLLKLEQHRDGSL
jgi:hypothetical protein